MAECGCPPSSCPPPAPATLPAVDYGPLPTPTRNGDGIPGPTTDYTTIEACCGGSVGAVLFDPPNGSSVAFPMKVRLYHPQEGVIIRYSIDSPADANSQIYNGELIQVNDPETVIYAYASKEGCADGDMVSAAYGTAEICQFLYLCDTPDKVGKWFNFGPAHGGDYHWKLVLNFIGTVEVKRIEIYQTNTKGVWNSGQAWSTDNPIFPAATLPWPGKTPSQPFSVYPVVIVEDNVQKNTTYLSTLGIFTPGEHILHLYGQPIIQPSGHFRIFVFFADGAYEQALVGTSCSADSAPICGTFVCGDDFESGVIGQPYPGLPCLIPGNFGCTYIAGLNGGKAIRPNPDGLGSGSRAGVDLATPLGYLTKPEILVKFDFCTPDLGSITTIDPLQYGAICVFASGQTIRISVNGPSTLGIYVGTFPAVLLGTITLPQPFQPSTWYSLSARMKVDPSTGFVEAKVNGVGHAPIINQNFGPFPGGQVSYSSGGNSVITDDVNYFSKMDNVSLQEF